MKLRVTLFTEKKIGAKGQCNIFGKCSDVRNTAREERVNPEQRQQRNCCQTVTHIR